ncbi:lamin B1, isoform CRA_c [Mus musculus]|nr:lamin B1, isoform CRA_c [Mus musculus]
MKLYLKWIWRIAVRALLRTWSFVKICMKRRSMRQGGITMYALWMEVLQSC